MTINYLDSKRIIKLSTDTVQTLSYENTSAVSIGTGDSGTSIDLTGSTLSNSWVLRFKLTMTSKANNLIFMVQDINTIDETTTRDGIGLRQTASTSYYDFEGCNGTAPTGGQYDHRFTTVPAIDTKYIQVTRISETSAKIEFCDSSYTVLESSGNITIADITNLRYFVIYNNGSALTVDDIDFWNGVSSITTKPTNVQDNSILVEKDTAIRYWFDAESANTSTDLDAVAWTNSPTGSTWGQSNNEITFANMTGSTEVMYYDVGTANISDTKWVLRFKLDIDSWSQGTTASSDWVIFGLSSTTGNSDTSQDSMVGVIRNNSSSQSLAITRTNGTTINSQLGSTDLEVLGATGSFYVEMIRTSDANYTLNVRSGSHSGTLLGSQDYTNASGVGGLRYIKAMNHLTSNTNADASGSFGEIELYNGVTSVTTPATWTMNPTYEEDFSNYTTQSGADASWVSLDTAKNRVNITTKKLDFNIVRDGTSDDIDYDFGTTVSDTAWVLRYKMVMNTPVAPSQYINGGPIGLSSNTGTNTMNIIGLGLEISHYTCTDILNGTASSSLNYLDDQFSHTPTAETLFVEIIRTSATSYTIELFSDSNYSTSVEKETVTNLSSSIVNLRYFHIRNFNNGANVGGSLSGTIDNIELYNGVTTIN